MEAYCQASNNEYRTALEIVREANELREALPPGGPLLDLSELPARTAPRIFWRGVFLDAFAKHGHMTVALLLVQDDAQFDQRAREARAKLLEHLREEEDAPESGHQEEEDQHG